MAQILVMAPQGSYAWNETYNLMSDAPSPFFKSERPSLLPVGSRLSAEIVDASTHHM